MITVFREKLAEIGIELTPAQLNKIIDKAEVKHLDWVVKNATSPALNYLPRQVRLFLVNEISETYGPFPQGMKDFLTLMRVS